jgi:hypothetical protein
MEIDLEYRIISKWNRIFFAFILATNFGILTSSSVYAGSVHLNPKLDFSWNSFASEVTPVQICRQSSAICLSSGWLVKDDRNIHPDSYSVEIGNLALAKGQKLDKYAYSNHFSNPQYMSMPELKDAYCGLGTLASLVQGRAAMANNAKTAANATIYQSIGLCTFLSL